MSLSLTLALTPTKVRPGLQHFAISLEHRKLPTGGSVVALYCQYWMVNLTGLPLEFSPWSHLGLASAGYPPSASKDAEHAEAHGAGSRAGGAAAMADADIVDPDARGSRPLTLTLALTLTLTLTLTVTLTPTLTLTLTLTLALTRRRRRRR